MGHDLLNAKGTAALLFAGFLLMAVSCTATTEGWKSDVLTCDDVTLACDVRNPSIYPHPYGQCSGSAFYYTCPNDMCVPESGDLALFFDYWKEVAPAAMRIARTEFYRHVYANELTETTDSNGWKIFRVQFLISVGWAVSRRSHEVYLRPWETLSAWHVEDELESLTTTCLGGIPGSAMPLEEVENALSQCHTPMTPYWCSIVPEPCNSPYFGRLSLTARGEIDLSANRCVFARLDVETGEILRCEETECSTY